MELLVQRERSTQLSTPGALYINGSFYCFTLEDVVREVPLIPVAQWKVSNATAIRSGTYRVIIDDSSRFGRPMPHIIGVEGFIGIRIHAGNTSADTEGCILLGLTRGTSLNVVQLSRMAFNPFFAELQAAIKRGEIVTIQIRNAKPIEEKVA